MSSKITINESITTNILNGLLTVTHLKACIHTQ